MLMPVTSVLCAPFCWAYDASSTVEEKWGIGAFLSISALSALMSRANVWEIMGTVSY